MIIINVVQEPSTHSLTLTFGFASAEFANSAKGAIGRDVTHSMISVLRPLIGRRQ